MLTIEEIFNLLQKDLDFNVEKIKSGERKDEKFKNFCAKKLEIIDSLSVYCNTIIETKNQLNAENIDLKIALSYHREYLQKAIYLLEIYGINEMLFNVISENDIQILEKNISGIDKNKIVNYLLSIHNVAETAKIIGFTHSEKLQDIEKIDKIITENQDNINNIIKSL